MKRIWFFGLLALFPLFLSAEVVQKGRVILQHSKGKGLEGVQVMAPSAIPVQTDKKGAFALTYSGLAAGDWAGISEVYKKGYEVVNADEVRNWILSPKTELVIIMCPEGTLQQTRERYYLSGDTHYKKKYEEALAALNRQKEQNQISADEYLESIRQAGQELDRALTQLDRLSRKLSEVSEENLNKTERKAWQLLEEGRFEEVLDILEKEQLKNELSAMIPSVRRYTDILMFAGGAENVEKAGKNLQQIASVSPEDFDAQFDYAVFLRERVDYPGAIEYLDKALLIAGNDLQKAKVFREQGEVYSYTQDFAKAEECMKKSYELYYSLAQQVPEIYYLKSAESLNYLGNVYYRANEFQKGIEALNNGLKLLDNVEEKTSYDYLYQKGSLLGTLGGIQFMNMVYNKEGNTEETEFQLTESLRIWEELAKINPYEINKIVSTSRSNLGFFYTRIKNDYTAAEKCIVEAVRLQEETDRLYPLTVREALGHMYRTLANLYRAMGNKELTYEYLDKSVAIDDEMIKINYKSFIANKISTLIVYAGALYNFEEPERGLELSQRAVELVTPMVKEDTTTYYKMQVNAQQGLIFGYGATGKFVEALKSIQPLRYLYKDEEIFANNRNLLMNPLNHARVIIQKAKMPEKEQDEEVKEIIGFVMGYFEEGSEKR